MINQDSLDVVEKSNFGPHFCKPIYDTYGFAQIPATTQRLLGVGKGGLPVAATTRETYDIVILFLLDGFGWELFDKHKEMPFLRRFYEQGIVSKITAQFPSTTAPHITCINTGLEVGQSGVYEWFYFEPKIDAVIAPLLFSYAGDHKPATLSKGGFSACEIFPQTTLYQTLQNAQVPSFVFQPEKTADSPSSHMLFQGAEVAPYAHLEAGLKKLQAKLQEIPRGYFYFYFGDVDSAAHRNGLTSKEVEKAVHEALVELEKFTAGMPDKKIALMVTADHGMIDIDPKTTFYLNKKIPQLEPLLCKNKTGKTIVPAGSCRDFFVHVQEPFLGEAEALLKENLQNIAEVHRVKGLIDNGFFGAKPPSDLFLSRVGNLVILPLEPHSIWWYEKHKFEQRFFAMHGGLSRKEMEIPFGFLEFAAL